LDGREMPVIYEQNNHMVSNEIEKAQDQLPFTYNGNNNKQVSGI
jgi:hypothetical protein